MFIVDISNLLILLEEDLEGVGGKEVGGSRWNSERGGVVAVVEAVFPQTGEEVGAKSTELLMLVSDHSKGLGSGLMEQEQVSCCSLAGGCGLLEVDVVGGVGGLKIDGEVAQEVRECQCSWEEKWDMVRSDEAQGGVMAHPLAIAYPDHDIGSPRMDEDKSKPSADEVSEQVLRQICEVSKVLGVTFAGHEMEAMRLFTAIELSRRGTTKTVDVGRTRQENRLARELQKLEWSVNYEGKSCGSRGGRSNNKLNSLKCS